VAVGSAGVDEDVAVCVSVAAGAAVFDGVGVWMSAEESVDITGGADVG
jgi:hypothetical protein